MGLRAWRFLERGQAELHEGLRDWQRQELHLVGGELREVGDVVFGRLQDPLDRLCEPFRYHDDVLIWLAAHAGPDIIARFARGVALPRPTQRVPLAQR